MSVPFVMTKSGLNVYVDGKMTAVGTDHPNFARVNELVRDTNTTADDIRELLDVAASLNTFSAGHVTVEGDVLKYDGTEMHNALTKRIIALLKEGKSVEIFVKFMENLMQNPSFRAVNELYGFLDACSLPLTADGCFLAYKKVRFDYMDLHSNTMSNALGKTVSMPRNQVDEDSSRTCSHGLHVASFGYLSHFGGTGTTDADDRVIVVKVNPADVVAVPKDYDNQKMRVCKYEVIDELPNDGFTQLVDWVYGNRDVAFLRDTVTSIKNMAMDFFKLDNPPKFEDQLFTHKVSEVMRENFLKAIATAFNLKTDPSSFISRYERSLTVKNILQWVSNYSE
jgi:hypothetical protein